MGARSLDVARVELVVDAGHESGRVPGVDDEGALDEVPCAGRVSGHALDA